MFSRVSLCCLLISINFYSCSTKDSAEKISAEEIEPHEVIRSNDGMVFIPGGEFYMGTDETEAYPVEKPFWEVFIDGKTNIST
jgi:sulfatase modifying factor 1